MMMPMSSSTPSDDQQKAGIRLTNKHWKIMHDDVLRCLPEEACGLLGGTEGVVLSVFPATNILHSPFRFKIDPHEHLRIFLWLEENEQELIGIYHSHPYGPPTPSLTDLNEFAYPGVINIIWSPLGDDWQARAFCYDDGFIEEVYLIIQNAT
jgi:proteasome lid subunit RPN8/RPN11